MNSKRILKPVNQKTMERDIEKYLVKRVKGVGGICRKFVTPGHKNSPDRICLFPTGLVFFVEVKRPGDVPTSGQLRELRILIDIGCLATWVDTKEKIDAWILMVQGAINERTANDPSNSIIIRPDQAH